jgi:hypothetical protein
MFVLRNTEQMNTVPTAFTPSTAYFLLPHCMASPQAAMARLAVRVSGGGFVVLSQKTRFATESARDGTPDNAEMTHKFALAASAASAPSAVSPKDAKQIYLAALASFAVRRPAAFVARQRTKSRLFPPRADGSTGRPIWTTLLICCHC